MRVPDRGDVVVRVQVVGAVAVEQMGALAADELERLAVEETVGRAEGGGAPAHELARCARRARRRVRGRSSWSGRSSAAPGCARRVRSVAFVERPLRVADAAGRRGDQVAHHQAGSDERRAAARAPRRAAAPRRRRRRRWISMAGQAVVGVRQQVRDRDAEIADPRGPARRRRSREPRPPHPAPRGSTSTLPWCRSLWMT